MLSVSLVTESKVKRPRGRPRIPDARILELAVAVEEQGVTPRHVIAEIHYNSIFTWLASDRALAYLVDMVAATGVEAAGPDARGDETAVISLWGGVFEVVVRRRAIVSACPSSESENDDCAASDLARTIELRYPGTPKSATTAGLLNRILVRLVAWNSFRAERRAVAEESALAKRTLSPTIADLERSFGLPSSPPSVSVESPLVGRRVRFDAETDGQVGRITQVDGEMVVILDDAGTEWNSEVGSFAFVAPSADRPPNDEPPAIFRPKTTPGEFRALVLAAIAGAAAPLHLHELRALDLDPSLSGQLRHSRLSGAIASLRREGKIERVEHRRGSHSRVGWIAKVPK